MVTLGFAVLMFVVVPLASLRWGADSRQFDRGPQWPSRRFRVAEATPSGGSYIPAAPVGRPSRAMRTLRPATRSH
jgi:hypothetical protein